ncbi:MAG TPA: hypothetical protein VHO84_06560 [Syntrophorhabdaceae bacterium]|nr:hypothetical protein [Syntrophorhabdaceae bacterium]
MLGIAFTVGMIWVGLCILALWVNHRFPRNHFRASDRTKSAKIIEVNKSRA